jgi:hypothetical protein
MNKIVKISMISLSLAMATSVNAADVDVIQLNEKVNQKVDQIAQTGLLPTSTEIEMITGDIVDHEVQATDLTVDEAVEKYQLTPTLERYIKIKKAQADLAAKSGGAGEEPPK